MIEYVISFQFVTIFVAFLYCEKPELETLKYYAAFLALLTAVIATIIFISQINKPLTRNISLYDFIIINNYSCKIGLLSDSLSIVSSWVICTITAITNFYSIGYIKKNISAFMLRINLFSFVMVFFITSNNLFQMYIFWELLSVTSYFLIIFDNKNESLSAGFKVITTHKFGDIGFIISMIALFHIFGSLNFEEINKISIGNDAQLKNLELVAIMMLASIFVKSAQIGSTTWLKNAMYAPIPASALIHSSILVTTGIFAVIRLQTLFECSELIQNITIVVGLSTAVLCAIKATFANNIKQIFAYSTCSQVGLMLLACGFSAYGAAIILFVTHAFSKSLLFFSAGSVIYALSGEQNIEKMGGLFNLLPKTYIAFITATISMIGIPLLPSYYTKKILLNEIMSSELPVYYISLISIIITSVLTCVYLFRTIYLVFHGQNKLAETIIAYINEDEQLITKSIYISMFFSIFSGVLFYYAVYTDVIWKDVFAFSYETSNSTILAFSIINLLGIAGAIFICKSIKPRNLSMELNLQISERVLNTISQFIRFIDTKIYRKCYIYFSKLNSFVFNYTNLFVCFLLIVFIYFMHWIE